MKMKKKLICTLMSALLFGLVMQNPTKSYGAGLEYEVEENNSYETANYINLGDSVTGNIAESDDVDYYMISSSTDGKISIDFCHDYVDSSDDWAVYVYTYENGKYTELSAMNIDLNSSERVQLPYIGAVENGVYYVKVEKGNYYEVIEKNYTVEVGFEASDYFEKEINDVYATATDVSLNHSYSGIINDYDDKDYYKIVAPKNGKIELGFNHVYEDSSDDWAVYVYTYENGEYTELSAMNIDLNSNERVQLPYIGAVESGVYYVKVEKGNYYEVIGKNYTIEVGFEASDYFEKEVNDVYATATEVSINHSYSGTINDYDDKDCYKIVAPENGAIKFSFIHTYEESYDDWNVYVYKYSNGEYIQLSSNTIDLNANKTISFPKVGVVKNGVYYVKVEKGNYYGVIGKNYTLNVRFYANAPSNFKAKVTGNAAKLTWSKANGANGYEVYCKVGSKGTYKKIFSTAKKFILI